MVPRPCGLVGGRHHGITTTVTQSTRSSNVLTLPTILSPSSSTQRPAVAPITLCRRDGRRSKVYACRGNAISWGDGDGLEPAKRQRKHALGFGHGINSSQCLQASFCVWPGSVSGWEGNTEAQTYPVSSSMVAE